MATARGCWRSIRPSIRWRCSWAARSRRELAAAARIGEDLGYDEINLNVGCPSDRVQSGRFGACLMAEPALVGRVHGRDARGGRHPGHRQVPHRRRRPGPGGGLFGLVDACAPAGVDTFVVHARKAWLQGPVAEGEPRGPAARLSAGLAAEARAAEPTVVINGGIASLDEAEAHLAHVDGVMLGRAAYQSPRAGRSRPAAVRRAAPFDDAFEALDAFCRLFERDSRGACACTTMTRHLLGLFAGRPGARAYRRVWRPRRSAPTPASTCCGARSLAWRELKSAAAAE